MEKIIDNVQKTYIEYTGDRTDRAGVLSFLRLRLSFSDEIFNEAIDHIESGLSYAVNNLPQFASDIQNLPEYNEKLVADSVADPGFFDGVHSEEEEYPLNPTGRLTLEKKEKEVLQYKRRKTDGGYSRVNKELKTYVRRKKREAPDA